MTLAEREKCVLEAQYRNAVRLAIDELGTAYVDALAQRYAARSAEQVLEALEKLRAQARAKLQRGDADEEAIDDLTIECELAAITRDGEQVRYLRAKQRLASLLDLSSQESAALELRGSLRELGPQAPPVDILIDIALGQRPDLSAFRLGVWRAQAELMQERAERFSDAYLLYTPFEYRDNSQVGLNSATSWGAGLFVSLPLFNRNQGNLKRARINVDQSRIDATSREQQVIAEVREAAREFENTYVDGKRLEQVALPALRRKRERAERKFRSGEIDTNQFLGVRRDSRSLMRYYRETLARHRRNALKLNTAVGHRVLP
jgi:cobalt-zinc-cadmium efflux system outer membrane protein